MKKAIIKKNKKYKFGQFLNKGEQVLIQEVNCGKIIFTAYRENNLTLGLGVNESDFEFVTN